MLFFALTTLQKIQQVPAKVWGYFFGFVIGFFLWVWIMKKIFRINRIYLGIASAVICLVVMVNWIFNRNEPAFLTPVVDELAAFFPVKGDYERSKGPRPPPTDQNKPTPPPPSSVY